MKRLTLAFAAVAIATAALPVPTAATAAPDPATIAWSVHTGNNDQGKDRPNFSYELTPGTTVRDSMVVTNTGTDTLTLAVYAADAFTTATGELDILPAGQQSTNGGAWVSPDASSITVTSGEAVEVGFTISVPPNAAPGDHPAGLVTSLVSQTSETVAVDRRLGTRIHLRVPGDMRPSVALSNVSFTYQPTWNPFDVGQASVSYSLTNTGNTRVSATDLTRMTGPFGIGAMTISGADLAEVMPGSTINVVRTAPFFSLGWADIKLLVAPEGVGLGGATLESTAVLVSGPAVPLGLFLFIAALIVVGVIVTLIIVRRARRRRIS